MLQYFYSISLKSIRNLKVFPVLWQHTKITYLRLGPKALKVLGQFIRQNVTEQNADGLYLGSFILETIEITKNCPPENIF